MGDRVFLLGYPPLPFLSIFTNMYRILLLFLLVSGMFMCGGVEAKTGGKKSKASFRLVDAFSQRMLPGKSGSTIKTDIHFILVWQDDRKPTDAFYWKSDNSWQQCIAAKAHSAVNGQVRAGFEYSQERAGLAGVNKGDTIILTPRHGSGSTVPEPLQKKKGNFVFYKMQDGSWIATPVIKLAQKRDIALP